MIKENFMEKSELLSELLETVANAENCFIKAEMKINDGDIAGSQNDTKKGQTLMKALIGDTFDEMEEEFGINTSETNDYDYPNNMELIKALNEICMHLGSFIGASEDIVKNIALKNLFKAINTAKEIYSSLYEN